MEFGGSMRILFLSHYYPPEVNAPATRTYEHCVRWARAGHEVTVITCAPNCPDGVLFEGYKNRLRPQVEEIEGVRVVRVWTYLAPNAGTLPRIVNYLSYLVSAVIASIRLSRPDVVVATSPQFFCGWAGVLVSRLKRVPFVLEIRDIWPESIEAVGAMRNRPLLRLLEWLEIRMYRAADRIVAVGNGYRQKILEKVDIPDRVSVVTNGVDLERFVPTDPDQRFLHVWDLENKFVCSYIGTIGMAHGLEVVLEAARMLRDKGRSDIAFCLVGDGAVRQRLQEEVERDGLQQSVVFTGMLPKEDMPRVLASSDACLIHLRKCELFGTVIPSKLFETMAMGRPIIMGVEGEARDIVNWANAGLEMEPGSAESLVQCVESLADQPGLTAELGRSARAMVAEHFARDVLADKLLRILHETAGIEAVPLEPAVPPPEPRTRPRAIQAP
jgi:glycosyltransferase involved in cell wall biosynthesis